MNLSKMEAAQRLLDQEEENRKQWCMRYPNPPRERNWFHRLMSRVARRTPRFLQPLVTRLAREMQLEDAGPPPKVDIRHELTTETWYGWVFYLQSEEYIRTGDEREALIGMGPTVVMKTTGEIVQLGTASPEDELLASFEQTLQPDSKRAVKHDCA
jgi:hypothetical protein